MKKIIVLLSIVFVVSCFYIKLTIETNGGQTAERVGRPARKREFG